MKRLTKDKASVESASHGLLSSARDHDEALSDTTGGGVSQYKRIDDNNKLSVEKPTSSASGSKITDYPSGAEQLHGPPGHNMNVNHRTIDASGRPQSAAKPLPPRPNTHSSSQLGLSKNPSHYSNFINSTKQAISGQSQQKNVPLLSSSKKQLGYSSTSPLNEKSSGGGPNSLSKKMSQELLNHFSNSKKMLQGSVSKEPPVNRSGTMLHQTSG